MLVRNAPLRKSIVMALLLIVLVVGPAIRCEGCFTIVVGKDASADGYVIIAHNEDDNPPQIVNHHKVPRKKYAADEKVQLINGGELEQVRQSWAAIRSEMPGMLFSDGYVNEWGVCVTSNYCPSREDKPKITDGGIGFMLRRLIAERAKSAREGVLLAGKLVERFGYVDTGRTYFICDPNEGWLFSVVNGKHWLAQKVPDNEVAMVANTYTIRGVDLSDKRNCLASSDIVEYAVSRGWYEPEKDGVFDFASVYANRQAASNPANFGRQWVGLKYVADKEIALEPDLPFSVVPKQKVGVEQIMEILRDDRSGDELRSLLPEETPYEINRAICVSRTQTSFVVQLRKDKPLDIGIVYWVCLGPPCSSFYIPFHFGIGEFPAGFRLKSEKPSEEFYNEKIHCPFKADPLQAFWTFSNFHNKVYGDSDKMQQVKTAIRQIGQTVFDLQKSFEETACRLYEEDKTTAMQLLTNYSDGIYLSSIEAMGKLLSDN